MKHFARTFSEKILGRHILWLQTLTDKNMKKQSLGYIFFKVGVLKHFANFIVKDLCWSLFLKKLQARMSVTLLKKDSNTGAFM